jgi:hypothetical protein
MHGLRKIVDAVPAAVVRLLGRRTPTFQSASVSCLEDKATGAVQYSVDVQLPGMLVGKLLHSPHANARIRSIDKSRALALPGVKAVISWEDISHIPFNPSVQDFNLHDTSNEVADMYGSARRLCSSEIRSCRGGCRRRDRRQGLNSSTSITKYFRRSSIPRR